MSATVFVSRDVSPVGVVSQLETAPRSPHLGIGGGQRNPEEQLRDLGSPDGWSPRTKSGHVVVGSDGDRAGD